MLSNFIKSKHILKRMAIEEEGLNASSAIHILDEENWKKIAIAHTFYEKVDTQILRSQGDSTVISKITEMIISMRESLDTLTKECT